MKISTKVSILTGALLTVTVLLTSSIFMVIMYREVCEEAVQMQETRMKTLWELASQKGKEFSIVDGKLMIGSYQVNGNFELPDKLKELCGGTATIFMQDTRVSTNVLKPDGSRAVGTKLVGDAYKAVIAEGTKFRGEIKVLGVPYFAAYDPIKDANGKTIGVIYVGVKKSDYLAPFYHLAWVIGTVTLVCVLAAVLLSAFAVRAQLRKLGDVADLMEQVAKGNLGIRLPASQGNNEVDQVITNVNSMLDNIGTAIRGVYEASSSIATASVQLDRAAEKIASNAETTAAQTLTIATASEQMVETCNSIAVNCSEAVTNSDQASQVAASGSEVVVSTIAGMERIASRVKSVAGTISSLGERSSQIGDILNTIEDIADQTNLLALNAAIEAARAGDMGRGFAVVADEVRALAVRTSSATSEIGAMIKAIQSETIAAVNEMSQGVHEVEHETAGALKSGDALKEILAQVDAVTMQINQITTAAEEQTATSSEITQSIQAMNLTAQETAQSANETATAATSLADLAGTLERLVVQFKLAS